MNVQNPKICPNHQARHDNNNKTQPESIVIPSSTMKLSTLALAALTMGTAHAQHAEFYKKVSQLRGAETPPAAPQGGITDDSDDIDQNLLNMCQQQDDTSCGTHEDCVWCDCEAVPSSCFSKQAAHKLPDRVYSCAFSSSDAAVVIESISEKVEEAIEEAVEKVEKSWQATAEKATKVQSFLMEGVELNLATDEVASDFCDASSPLSLAGYMNGEFLILHRSM